MCSHNLYARDREKCRLGPKLRAMPIAIRPPRKVVKPGPRAPIRVPSQIYQAVAQLCAVARATDFKTKLASEKCDLKIMIVDECAERWP